MAERCQEKLAELIGIDKFTKVDAELEIEYAKKIDGATKIRFTYRAKPVTVYPAICCFPTELKIRPS